MVSGILMVEMADRPVSFRAHRHAAPKNSPPGCFFNGCFDYRIKNLRHAKAYRRLMVEMAVIETAS